MATTITVPANLATVKNGTLTITGVTVVGFVDGKLTLEVVEPTHVGVDLAAESEVKAETKTTGKAKATGKAKSEKPAAKDEKPAAKKDKPAKAKAKADDDDIEILE